MTTTIAAIIAIILIVFSWYRGGKFREIALDAAKGLCKRSNVELLDDRVSLFKVKICRDFDKKMKCLRAYTFEYTNPDMNDRCVGFVALMGSAVILRRLEISSFDAAMHVWLKEESFKRKHKIKFLFSFGSVQGITRKVAVGDAIEEDTKTINNINTRRPSNDSNIIDFKAKKEAKINNKNKPE